MEEGKTGRWKADKKKDTERKIAKRKAIGVLFSAPSFKWFPSLYANSFPASTPRFLHVSTQSTISNPPSQTRTHPPTSFPDPNSPLPASYTWHVGQMPNDTVPGTLRPSCIPTHPCQPPTSGAQAKCLALLLFAPQATPSPPSRIPTCHSRHYKAFFPDPNNIDANLEYKKHQGSIKIESNKIQCNIKSF